LGVDGVGRRHQDEGHTQTNVQQVSHQLICRNVTQARREEDRVVWHDLGEGQGFQAISHHVECRHQFWEQAAAHLVLQHPPDLARTCDVRVDKKDT
jgi:hypothetical protein